MTGLNLPGKERGTNRARNVLVRARDPPPLRCLLTILLYGTGNSAILSHKSTIAILNLNRNRGEGNQRTCTGTTTRDNQHNTTHLPPRLYTTPTEQIRHGSDRVCSFVTFAQASTVGARKRSPGRGQSRTVCRIRVNMSGPTPVESETKLNSHLHSLLMLGQGRFNKTREQWMWRGRLRFELRVILHGHKPRMIRNFDDLRQAAVWTVSRWN